MGTAGIDWRINSLSKKYISEFCDLNYHSPSVNLQGFAIGRDEKHLWDLRAYSPRLKDVAWLEDARFIFLIFHTFVSKFGQVDAVRGKKNTDKCMENKKN